MMNCKIRNPFDPRQAMIVFTFIDTNGGTGKKTAVRHSDDTQSREEQSLQSASLRMLATGNLAGFSIVTVVW